MKMRNRVLATRAEMGISQHELCRRTGLSRLTIRAVERDDGYTPNGAVMLRLSEALGADMNSLFWSEREPEVVA